MTHIKLGVLFNVNRNILVSTLFTEVVNNTFRVCEVGHSVSRIMLTLTVPHHFFCGQKVYATYDRKPKVTNNQTHPSKEPIIHCKETYPHPFNPAHLSDQYLHINNTDHSAHIMNNFSDSYINVSLCRVHWHRLVHELTRKQKKMASLTTCFIDSLLLRRCLSSSALR